MMQAFYAGTIAKSVATLITYPLIRAKVKMMSREQDEEKEELGVVATIVDIIDQQGLGGLFKGMGTQVFHTVLKSALLLVIKEEVDSFSYRVMRGDGW